MEIISGIGRKYKQGLGGISKVYLMKWQPYSRSQIVRNDDYLLSFPTTTIYEFVSLQNPVFTENYSESNEYYEQTISLVFPKIDGKKLRYLKCLEFRIIIKDNNGIFHIFGLDTGLQVASVNYTTGSAKSDLNGLKIDFTAKEEYPSLIIEDLEEVGFINNGTEETFFFTAQNTRPIFTEDNNNLILQNG